MIRNNPAIMGENVTFRYEHGDKIILNNCSWTFHQGEITALVGKNGEGKTTIGKLCTSILKPTSGNIFLYGRDTKSIKLSEVAKDLCYCFQSPTRQLFADTVEEEIAFALKYKKVPQKQITQIVEEMLEIFELKHIRKSYPLRLSGGEQQRLAIAAGLALKPKFLLLDEPTASLDQSMAEKLSKMLKKLCYEHNMGIVLISHDTSFVNCVSDKVWEVQGGKIYAS